MHREREEVRERLTIEEVDTVYAYKMRTRKYKDNEDDKLNTVTK
mgnify:CR=1 FL=1